MHFVVAKVLQGREDETMATLIVLAVFTLTLNIANYLKGLVSLL